MKFSLPGFPGRSRSHAAQAGGQDMPQPVADAKPASLVKVRNRILLGAMVLLALLALFIFQLMSISISRAMDREVNITTQQVAARVAAIAGHTVDLYEQAPRIGGQVLLAGTPPGS